MIRKCNETDRESIMQFIGKYPAENLFMIGDIEVYGFESNIQKVWAQYEGDKLVAVMLFFSGNYIIYSEGQYDAIGFAEIINATKGRFEVSGLQHIVTQIRPFIPYKKLRDIETHYAKCERLAYSIEQIDYTAVQLLEEQDYEENIDMLFSIPEFAHGTFSIESRRRAKENKTGRTYIIRNQHGIMVSSASSTAENSASAMIVGVGTKPGFEKKGYATRLVEKLTKDLHDEGKIVCLFYSNPSAGAIYRRIGFEDIGYWTLMTFLNE